LYNYVPKGMVTKKKHTSKEKGFGRKTNKETGWTEKENEEKNYL